MLIFWVWLGFEVAAFGCVSVSSIANVRDGALLG